MEKCTPERHQLPVLECASIVRITDALIDFNQAAIEAIQNFNKLVESLGKIQKKCHELNEDVNFPCDIHPYSPITNTPPVSKKPTCNNKTTSFPEENIEKYISKIFGDFMKDNE